MSGRRIAIEVGALAVERGPAPSRAELASAIERRLEARFAADASAPDVSPAALERAIAGAVSAALGADRGPLPGGGER